VVRRAEPRAGSTLRLAVTAANGRATLQPLVEAWTPPGCTVYTDEWVAYDLLPKNGRARLAVKHSRPDPQYARDADGDGVNEVHCNTLEGVWTGLRNFLRPFRGVSKRYLEQYVAIFQWGYELKSIDPSFVRALLLNEHTPDGT
jgi:transposase